MNNDNERELFEDAINAIFDEGWSSKRDLARKVWQAGRAPLLARIAELEAAAEKVRDEDCAAIQNLIDGHRKEVGGECDESCDIVAGMEAAHDAIRALKREGK